MADEKPEVSAHSWELLLQPGISWFIWDEDGNKVFLLPPDDGSRSGDLDSRNIETVFPPDIAFLLHEIICDTEEMKPGEIKDILLHIPGNGPKWTGTISMLSNNRLFVLWSDPGRVKQQPDSCDLDDHIRSEHAIRKANEKLNYFNSVVCHDMMNLIMGITGYLDIIDELNRNEEVRLLLKKCRNLGEQLKRVTELIRSYQDLGIRSPSFIEAGPTILRVLKRHEFSGKIKFEVDLPDIFLFADRLFDVVIYEMVRNSLQYGGEGVTIRFTYNTTPEGLILVIEDSGPGIHPDMRERLFSRTYTDRRGYGLYLASEILDITRITIRETGTYGTGARFELLFSPDSFRFGNNF